jgi:hypothetical protein
MNLGGSALNVGNADCDDRYDFFACGDSFFSQSTRRSKGRKGISLGEISLRLLLHLQMKLV